MCKNICCIRRSPSTNQAEQTKFFLKQAFLILKICRVNVLRFEMEYLSQGDF